MTNVARVVPYQLEYTGFHTRETNLVALCRTVSDMVGHTDMCKLLRGRENGWRLKESQKYR